MRIFIAICLFLIAIAAPIAARIAWVECPQYFRGEGGEIALIITTLFLTAFGYYGGMACVLSAEDAEPNRRKK